MAAGLAHELNNPAAAARRAASDLADGVEAINRALRAVVESGIERDDAAKLLALQQEALERCVAHAARRVGRREDDPGGVAVLRARRAGLDAQWVTRV